MADSRALIVRIVASIALTAGLIALVSLLRPAVMLVEGASDSVQPIIAASDQVTRTYRPLHEPNPKTNIKSFSQFQVISQTGVTRLITGTSDADCNPDPLGLPTSFVRAEVGFGDSPEWKPATVVVAPDKCSATWSFQWPVPATYDGEWVRINARSISEHGGGEWLPLQRTFVDVQVGRRTKIDFVAPSPLVTTSFQFSWNATDVSGIKAFELDYSADGVSWVRWQTNPSGSVPFGPTSPVPISRGRAVFFRARATDGNNIVSPYTEATLLWPTSQLYVPGVPVERD